MKALLLLLALLGLLPPAMAAPAATPKSAPGSTATSSNRYLIILETSKAMERRAEGVMKIVNELLEKGMGGQLRSGDTLGVWTYNDHLYAGNFPLQRWTRETHRNVSQKVWNFLNEHPYEKTANLEPVLAAMHTVIKNSDVITVILISDGEQPIRGTPFDAQINNAYKLWKKEQQKAKMPYVTVLRGTKGKITDHTVASAPWPVEIPPVPPEEKPVPVAQPATPPPKKAPPPMAAPLIISGKKPEKAEPEKATEPPPSTNEQPGQAAPPVAANPVQAEPPAIASKPETAPGTDAEPKTSAPSATPLVGTETKPAATVTPEPPGTATESTTVRADDPPNAAPAISQTPDDEAGSTNEMTDSAPGKPARVNGNDVVAMAPDSLVSPKNIVIVGVALAAIVVVVGLLSFRRSRPDSHTSLITRSLNRDDKV